MTIERLCRCSAIRALHSSLVSCEPSLLTGLIHSSKATLKPWLKLSYTNKKFWHRPPSNSYPLQFGTKKLCSCSHLEIRGGRRRRRRTGRLREVIITCLVDRNQATPAGSPRQAALSWVTETVGRAERGVQSFWSLLCAAEWLLPVEIVFLLYECVCILFHRQ